MTETITHDRTLVPDRLPFFLAIMLGVWVPATLIGLASHVVGAAIGLLGVTALAYLALRKFLSAELRLRPPEVWGLLVLAASPLVPARLGPTAVGIGADDLPMLLGTGLLVWGVVRHDGWRGVLHPLAAPLALLAVWSLVSDLAAGSFDLSQLSRGFGRWALVALAFSALLSVARRPGFASGMLSAVLVVGLLEALFGLWAYYTTWTWLDPDKARLIGLELFRFYQKLYGEVPGRISGTLGVSSNFFGALMLFPTLIATVKFADARSLVHRMVYALVALACCLALVLSYTRASVVAGVLGLLVVVLGIRRWNVAGLAVVLVLAGALLTPIETRFSEGNNRLALSEAALEAIGARFGFGIGSGDFADSQFDPTDPRAIPTPHNSFLLAAVEAGALGGLLLLAGAVLPGLAGIRATIGRRKLPDHSLIVGATGAMLAFGVHTLSNNLFHIPNVAIIYWIVAAATIGLRRVPTSEEQLLLRRG